MRFKMDPISINAYQYLPPMHFLIVYEMSTVIFTNNNMCRIIKAQFRYRLDKTLV